jgi:sulfate transport system permease protein
MAARFDWERRALIAAAVMLVALLLVLPLAFVLAGALSKGLSVYWAALVEPDALAALQLTLGVVAIAVPCNCAFGVAAAWAIAKFDFRG